MVQYIEENQFQAEVLESDIPVLVDFYADWCGPCKMMSPVLDQIASEQEGKLKIVKVNVDNAQDLAISYNVMSIPNMVLFQGGEPKENIVGAMPKPRLMSQLKAYL